MTAIDGRILFAHRTRAGPIWHTLTMNDWIRVLVPRPNLLIVNSTCGVIHVQDPQKWKVRPFDATEMVMLFMDGENICWACAWRA